MIKAIENFIKSIIRFVFKMVRELSEYASTNSKQNEAVVSVASESGPAGMIAKDELPPLATERPVILIECISCGSVGKLTAICQNCRKPVCSESFCGKEVYKDDLNISVIQCRNCAITGQT